MNEKRFRVRFEQEDGKGEVVNEKGVELTAREVVDLLNEQQATINKLKEENKELEDEHDDFSNFLIDKGLEFEFEKWCKDE